MEREETFEKCSISFKITAREDFNRRNILNISRIKTRAQPQYHLLELRGRHRYWSKGGVFQRSREISPFRGAACSICTLLLILLSFFPFEIKFSAAAEDQAAIPLEIKDIQFKLKEDGKEVVYIYANRDFTPSVFALNGGNPRLVIDIKDLPAYKKGPSKIVVNGRFIRQIRTHFHDKSKTLRVVLDHDPSMKYVVSQIFFEAEKIFVIEVEEQQKGEGK